MEEEATQGGLAAPAVAQARPIGSERRGGGEEDKKMSMTCGVHKHSNIWRVQF